jgi:hypothetical protein
MTGPRKTLFKTPDTRPRNKPKTTVSDPPADTSTTSYPDLTDVVAIQQSYSLAELQRTMRALREDTTGTKGALAARMREHALRAPGHRVHDTTLTDVQAIYVLQRMGIEVDTDPVTRRTRALEALPAGVDLTSTPSRATAPSEDVPSDERLPPSATLQAELSELRATVMALQTQLGAAARTQEADRQDPISNASDFAAAIVRAFQDVAPAGTDTHHPGTDTQTAQRIRRTAPHLIDPRQHDNDPHKLGLMVQRMTTITFSDSAGLAAITWKRSSHDKVAAIHLLIHAESGAEDYAGGEARFFAHICELITLAAQHDVDAARYAPQRQQQLLWWMHAWDEMRQNVRDATRYWGDPVLAYRMQMEDLITTALGVGLSNAQLRNLHATTKLRRDLGVTPRRNTPSAFVPDKPPAPGSFGGTRVAGGRPGMDGSTPAPPARRNTETTGKRMPTARAIIGHNSGGCVPVNTKCYACGKAPEKDGEGHRSWECPAKFAAEHPGRRMPGFDDRGARRPGCWDGDDITPETGRQWERMQAMGYFNTPHDERQGRAPPGARK